MPGYLVPTNTVDQSTTVGGYNILSAVNAGAVLQVVNGTTTTQASTTTTEIDTNLTATITPTSATSKILVLTSQPIRVDNVANTGYHEYAGIVSLYRGGTILMDHGTGGEENEPGYHMSYSHSSFNHLDSPATTSAVTYKTRMRTTVTPFTIYAQNTKNYTGTLSAPLGSITLMEIAG